MSFKVQYVEVSIASGDTTKSVYAPASFTAVGALSKAFIISADSRAIGAFGVDGNTTSTLDDGAFTIEFDAVDTITIRRSLSGVASTVSFYIVEYTGAAGGPNEFINRGTIGVDLGDSAGSAEVTVSGIATLGKCVPFATGRSTDPYYSNQLSGRILADIRVYNNGSNNVVRAARRVWYQPVRFVVQVIEFTGSAWTVQERAVSVTADNTNTDTAITAVSALNKAFVHSYSSTGGDSASFCTYYAWLSSTSNLRVRMKDTDAGGITVRAWVIENPNISTQLVEAVNGTNDWSGGGSSPQDQTLSISSVNTSRSFIRGYAGSDVSPGVDNELFPAYIWRWKFNSSTEVRARRYNTGGGTEYAVYVVELPSEGVTITGAGTSGVFRNTETGKTITGTGFGASQGSGTVTINGVAQTVTAWSDTSITISVVRGTNRYNTGYTLTVTNNSGQSNTFTVSFLPQTGWSYVNLSGVLATSTKRLTTTGTDLVAGDQVAYGAIVGTGSVTVLPNGTHYADSGVTSFDFEVHDTTGWGTSATQTYGSSTDRSGTASVSLSSNLLVEKRKNTTRTVSVALTSAINITSKKQQAAVFITPTTSQTAVGRKNARGTASISLASDIAVVRPKNATRAVAIPHTTGIAVNKAKGAKAAVTIPTTISIVSTGAFGSQSGRNTLKGQLDEIRIWNVVRATNDVAANKAQEVDPASVGLIGYWSFNEGNGLLATDLTGNSNTGTLGGNVGYVPSAGLVAQRDVARIFTADDIKEGTLTLTRRGLRNYPTSVVVEYRDSSVQNTWRLARQKAEHPGVSTGSVPRRLSRLSLPGIHRAAQAKREAVERINYFISDLTGSFQCWDEALNLQPGSIIAVSHPIGLELKLFRVLQISGNKGRWTVSIAEYDPAAYSDEVIATPTFVDTNLGDPLTPPVPGNLSAVEELFIYKDGGVGSRIRISWNATSYAFFSQFIVECYVNDVLTWNAFTQSNQVITPPVEQLVDNASVPYQIKVYTQSQFTRSNPATTVVDVRGKLSPPGDVPAVTSVLTRADTAQLTWQQAIDIDIWRYEVRKGLTSDTWDTATLVDKTDALTLAVPGLEVGTHRLFVKAIDSVRNYSTNAAYIDVVVALPDAVAAVNGFEIGGEVRLSWAAVGGFVTKYRVTYSTTSDTNEKTLDVVDSLRFITKEVPAGTWRFRVYAVDDAGREAAAPPYKDILVTVDANAFVAGEYDFVNPTLTNMVKWNVRTDPRSFYVTNMLDLFLSSPSTFSTYSATPLATYHSAGASAWISETHDFGAPLSGTWVLTTDAVPLQGSINIYLELSTDGVAFDPFTGTAAGQYRYARVRIIANSTTSTIFVMTPTVNLKINALSQTENGQDTSLSSGPKTITLSKAFSAVKAVSAQPIASEPLTSVIDNIVVGGTSPSSFDVYIFDIFGQQIAATFKYNFEGV